MANIGSSTIAGLFMSQNVEMLVNQTKAEVAGWDTAPADEWVALRQVHYIKAHPKARTDHGATRTYGFAAPDAEVQATFSASVDQINLVEKMTTRNGLAQLPKHRWMFRAAQGDGTGRSMTFDGWMYAVEFIKRDGHPGEPADIAFSIQLESTKPTPGVYTVTASAGTFSGNDAGGKGAGDLHAPEEDVPSGEVKKEEGG